jgi:hypothetical protein
VLIFKFVADVSPWYRSSKFEYILFLKAADSTTMSKKSCGRCPLPRPTSRWHDRAQALPASFLPSFFWRPHDASARILTPVHGQDTCTKILQAWLSQAALC